MLHQRKRERKRPEVFLEVSSSANHALSRYEKAENRCRLIEIYMPTLMYRANKHESRKKLVGNLHSMHLLATVRDRSRAREKDRAVSRAREKRQREKRKKEIEERANVRESENVARVFCWKMDEE